MLVALVDIFALQQCRFGVWNVEDSHLHAVLVGFCLEISRCNVLSWVKGIEPRDCQFTDTDYTVETICEAGIDRCIKQEAEIELFTNFHYEFGCIWLTGFLFG